MGKSYLFIVGLVLSATPLPAAQITIETDDSAMFIRCVDMAGNSRCEMIFRETDAVYECIAFNADGRPVGTTSAMGGAALFRDLANDEIADVKCR